MTDIYKRHMPQFLKFQKFAAFLQLYSVYSNIYAVYMQLYSKSGH